MPNIAVHYACAMRVANQLHIADDDFIRGNIILDYVDKKRHYRMQGKMFEIPNIEAFLQTEGIDSFLHLGFLSHLLLDRYFLEEYVVDSIYNSRDKSENIFVCDKIYQDYSNMSKRVLGYYSLSLDDLIRLMQESQQEFDYDVFQLNIDMIRESVDTTLSCIDMESFMSFLDHSIARISNCIKTKKLVR